jgi:hypothetical protein
MIHSKSSRKSLVDEAAGLAEQLLLMLDQSSKNQDLDLGGLPKIITDRSAKSPKIGKLQNIL